MKVMLTSIKPKKMQVASILREQEKALDKFAKQELTRDFHSTVKTFRRRPKVQMKSEPGKRTVFIEDEIYFYLSEGTRIRWALMSRNWRSKTRPGRIPAGPGRGYAVIVGRRNMLRRGRGPRPGIKARKYDVQIVKKRRAAFNFVMGKAVAEGAAKAF